MAFKMGLLGRKLGMTQMFHEDGTALGCTVLALGPCVVTGQRTSEKAAPRRTDAAGVVQRGLRPLDT